MTDSKNLQPSWQPHFFYAPHLTAGVIRQSFDVWCARDAQFFTEWRDSGDYPRNIGASVRFDGSGQVTVAGKSLTQLPAETWIHADIEAALGQAAPRTFQLTLQAAGGERPTFADLPIAGVDFHELHRLGFVSTAAADTEFFLDQLNFGPAANGETKK